MVTPSAADETDPSGETPKAFTEQMDPEGKEVLSGNVLTPVASEDIASSSPLCTWPRLKSFFHVA